MADGDDRPFLSTEPVPLVSLYCAGFDVESTDHCIRFSGWDDLVRPGVAVREARILVRFVMSPEGARAFARDLRKALSKGGH